MSKILKVKDIAKQYGVPSRTVLEELAGQIIEETRYVENVPVRVSLKEQRTVGQPLAVAFVKVPGDFVEKSQDYEF